MRKIGQGPAAESQLPYKTTRLRAAASKEFLDAYQAIKRKLPWKFRRMLREVLGIGMHPTIGWGHASHMYTRNVLSEAVAIRVARDLEPDRPMAFVTLIHDGWSTPLSKAKVDLSEIKQRARDCLQQLGFQGIAAIEFDVLVQPGGMGHLLLPHIHAVGYIDCSASERRKRLRKLRKSKRLKPSNGARTACYKKLRTKTDVMHAFCYALKLPLRVKRMVPHKTRIGKMLGSGPIDVRGAI